MIIRNEYLYKLKVLKDKDIIKVITGIRRCGKSTLLKQFRDELIKNGVDEKQTLYLNFEDYSLEELQDPKKLHEYILSNLDLSKKNYVFLDEIQMVEDFPKVVNSLFSRDNIDLYITGSNAYMLSSEIATYLSGRYIEIKMLPLSFKEFVSTKEDKNNLENHYLEYIKTTSFPYVLNMTDDLNLLNDYLEGIYNTVIIKDIKTRKKISDTMLLESVIRFIADNIGNEFSTKKISDTLTSNGRKIDVRTVEKYIDALMESFIIYQAKRYDIKGKQYLKTLDKYYLVDIGFRNMLLGNKGTDVGHILENIVYLELLRRGKKVYVGKVGDLEVDFVAQDAKGKVYYQVAATVRDEETLNRELKSLQKIQDNYPKIILTLDNDPDADYEGIKKINVLKWLID